jgi:hydroxyacylglutathione hydrolase
MSALPLRGRCDVRAFTVGLVQENSYIVRASPDTERAVFVDPGDEPERLLAAVDALGVQIEAILITHCHFDHIGAVAPVAKATGAPVYCPVIERPVLADVMKWVPPGFGPFESYEADHTLAGGERLSLAGLDIEVIFTPGHSPGHLTYAITGSNRASGTAPAGGTAAAGGPPRGATQGQSASLLSGDVLFAGSVGRVDLPGGDWPTLERSIGNLLRTFPPQTGVFPGHMGVTTLGRERDTNPFLSELRVPVPTAGDDTGVSGLSAAIGTTDAASTGN